MTIYPNYYPLGGSNQNGQHRSATTSTSSSTTIGTGAGNLGTGIAQSVTVSPGATYAVSTASIGSGGVTVVPGVFGPIPVAALLSQQKHSPPQDAGIRAGEITAYRAWLFYPDYASGNLQSVFATYRWTPGASEKSGIPVDDCSAGSGFHAFKDPGHCLGEYGRAPASYIGAVF